MRTAVHSTKSTVQRKTGQKDRPVPDNHVNPAKSSGSSPGVPDFVCENHGSIFLLYPLSRAAFDWIDSNLSPDRQLFGDAFAIEAKFIWDILLGIQDSELTVRPR